MATSRRFGTMEAAYNFIDSLPFNAVREMLAEFLTESPVDKIVITEEQFKKCFRIRGFNENGDKENRGRQKLQTTD